jgi:hypothetical protein
MRKVGYRMGLRALHVIGWRAAPSACNPSALYVSVNRNEKTSASYAGHLLNM